MPCWDDQQGFLFQAGLVDRPTAVTIGRPFQESVMVANPKFKTSKHAFVFDDHYEVTFTRCDTPEKILSWVAHLSEKSWMTAETLGEFVIEASGRVGVDVFTAD